MKWLLGKESNIKRDSFFWNVVGAGFSACQSAIILVFLSRTDGLEAAGIVTIGFALANLFMTMGNYGITPFMVTDVNEDYTFSEYVFARKITVSLSLAAAILYLAFRYLMGEYSLYKITVCLGIILLKLTEAFLFVFHSRFQQKGRLDICAKLYTFSIVFSTAVICLGVIGKVDLIYVFPAGIICLIFLFMFGVKKVFFVVKPEKTETFVLSKVKKLLKVCAPLCISSTVAIFNGNAPKYHIDAAMNEEAQAIFGYIMMPMFVLYLFNSFLLSPILKELAEIWNSGEFNVFKRKMVLHCLILFGLSLVVLVGGYYIGLPMLSLLYVVDLNEYSRVFLIIMLGGIFYTLSSYFGTILTTIRCLNVIMVIEALVAGINLLIGTVVTQHFGMDGAAWLYVFVNALLLGVKGGFSVYSIRCMCKEKFLFVSRDQK